jgi:multisubunit Na+/H+ antiporter MnhE subunit
VLLFGGYLALVSPLSGGEFILGALLSVVAGCAGVLARRASGSSFVVSWRWLGLLVRLPAAVLADTLLLTRLLWSQLRGKQAPGGALRTLPVARQCDAVRGQSWQAVAGLMLSLSPGSFVLDSGGDSEGQAPRLLVHGIRGQPSAMERSAMGRSVHQ